MAVLTSGDGVNDSLRVWTIVGPDDRWRRECWCWVEKKREVCSFRWKIWSALNQGQRNRRYKLTDIGILEHDQRRHIINPLDPKTPLLRFPLCKRCLQISSLQRWREIGENENARHRRRCRDRRRREMRVR